MSVQRKDQGTVAEDSSAVSSEELEAQEASELPDREAMSLINANIAIPVNAAIAANVLSDGSNATAGATQQTPIGQGI
ncbi:MAG: hypothetical protein ACR2PL_26850 [Dehalococcoidia bacterium]